MLVRRLTYQLNSLFSELTSNLVDPNATLQESVKVLIKQHDLSHEEALKEVEPLGHHEAALLAATYDLGLRGEHFVAMKDTCKSTTDELATVLVNSRPLSDYFYLLLRYELKQLTADGDKVKILIHVLDQCASLDPENELKIYFLRNHISDGIRSTDLPDKFSHDHRDLYHFLTTWKDYSSEDAVNEMQGLKSWQARMIIDYYDDGIRRQHIKDLGHFERSDIETLIRSVKDAEIPYTLQTLGSHGVNASRTIIYLCNEMDMDVDQAISEVSGKSAEDILRLRVIESPPKNLAM